MGRLPFHLQCLQHVRTTWWDNETPESARDYRDALLESECVRVCTVQRKPLACLPIRVPVQRLTLAPVGRNTLCYRFFEAAASGSTPVVEDVIMPPTCLRDPLAQLKASGAPFIYVRNWTSELPEVLVLLTSESPRQRAQRRQRLLSWYGDFLYRMQTLFFRVLADSFDI